jgi:hypothetical protein
VHLVGFTTEIRYFRLQRKLSAELLQDFKMVGKVTLHQRIPLQMYRKTGGWAKSHPNLMQTKTKLIDSLDLTYTVCYTRVT